MDIFYVNSGILGEKYQHITPVMVSWKSLLIIGLRIKGFLKVNQ